MDRILTPKPSLAGLSCETSGDPIVPRKKQQRNHHSDADWESQKQAIVVFYLHDDRSLDEIVSMLKTNGFNTGARSLKTRLKKWNLNKHLKDKEMRVLLERRNQRAALGKQTVFRQNGIIMPDVRFDNFERRPATKYAQPSSPEAHTPACVTYSTPPDTTVMDCDLDLDFNKDLVQKRKYQDLQAEASEPGRWKKQMLTQSASYLGKFDLFMLSQYEENLLDIVNGLTAMHLDKDDVAVKRARGALAAGMRQLTSWADDLVPTRDVGVPQKKLRILPLLTRPILLTQTSVTCDEGNQVTLSRSTRRPGPNTRQLSSKVLQAARELNTKHGKLSFEIHTFHDRGPNGKVGKKRCTRSHIRFELPSNETNRQTGVNFEAIILYRDLTEDDYHSMSPSLPLHTHKTLFRYPGPLKQNIRKRGKLRDRQYDLEYKEKGWSPPLGVLTKL